MSTVVLQSRRHTGGSGGGRRGDDRGDRDAPVGTARQSYSWRDSDERRPRRRDDERRDDDANYKRRQDPDTWHDSAEQRHHSGQHRDTSGNHTEDWLNSEGKHSRRNDSGAPYRHRSGGTGSHRRGGERESGHDAATWHSNDDRNSGNHGAGTHRRSTEEGSHRRRSDGQEWERGSRRSREDGHRSSGATDHHRSSGGDHERHDDRAPQDKEIRDTSYRRESKDPIGHESASGRHASDGTSRRAIDGTSRRHRSSQHGTEKSHHERAPDDRPNASGRSHHGRRGTDDYQRVKCSSERGRRRCDSDIGQVGQSSAISFNRGDARLDQEAKTDRRRHRHRRHHDLEHRERRRDRSGQAPPAVISSRPLQKHDPGRARSNSALTELEDDPRDDGRLSDSYHAERRLEGAAAIFSKGDPRRQAQRSTRGPHASDLAGSDNSEACASKKRRHRSPANYREGGDVRHQTLQDSPRDAIAGHGVARDGEPSPLRSEVRNGSGLRSPVGQEGDDDYSDASHASKEMNLNRKHTDPNEQAQPAQRASDQRDLLSEDSLINSPNQDDSAIEDDDIAAKQDPYLQADLSDAIQMSEGEEQPQAQARGGVVLPEERREQMRRQLEAAKARAQMGERTQSADKYVVATGGPAIAQAKVDGNVQGDLMSESYSYSPYSRSASRSRSRVVLQEAPNFPTQQDRQSASRSSSRSASGSASNSGSRSPSQSGSRSCSRSGSPDHPPGEKYAPQASTQPPISPLDAGYQARPPHGMHWNPDGQPAPPQYPHSYDQAARPPYQYQGQAESSPPPGTPGWNSPPTRAVAPPPPHPHTQQSRPQWQPQAPPHPEHRPYGDWPPHQQPVTHNPPPGVWGQAAQTQAPHPPAHPAPAHPPPHPENRPPWEPGRPPASHPYYPPVAHPFYPQQVGDTSNPKGDENDKGSGRRRRKHSDGNGDGSKADPPPPPQAAPNAGVPLDRPPGFWAA